MSENASESENKSKPAPDTAKPKSARKAGKKAKSAKKAGRAKKAADKPKAERANKKAELIAMMGCSVDTLTAAVSKLQTSASAVEDFELAP